MLLDDPVSARVQTSEVTPPREHAHSEDVGFGSLVAFFLSMSAFVSIRSSSLLPATADEGVLLSFLAFTGAACLTLLVLAMAEPYILRHDGRAWLALASGVLMFGGSCICLIEGAYQALSSFATTFAFSLSGCGYAMCVLVWGRILSAKKPGKSSRQILADVCAAVVVMTIVSVLPEAASVSTMALLGLLAGLIGFRRVSLVEEERSGEQVVVSDTRSIIPRSAYFAAVTMWMGYGIFWVLLGDVRVFDGYWSAGAVSVVVVAAVAGIAVVRLHGNFSVDLTRASWVSVPLLVMGLVVFAAGSQHLLKVAATLVVLSMVASYLHLMAHFSALAHRPKILSDQMFAWGWLAPFAGMFLGVFVGLICRLIGNFAIDLVLSTMGGALVVALIVSMRSIEKIAVRRREREVQQQAAEDALRRQEERMDEVFSDMGLTIREREVARLLLQGHSQASIAEQLFVASSTVNTHIKHIYRKLGIRSKQEFVDLCRKEAQVEEKT